MSYSNILVIIDSPKINYVSLFESLLPYCDIEHLKVTLFSTLNHRLSRLGSLLDTDEQQSLLASSISTQQSLLENLQTKLRTKYPNINFHYDTSWHTNPISDILEHLAVYKNDLVVKFVTGITHNYLLSPNLSANLIRRCPANILFIKDVSLVCQSVLVAVNTLGDNYSQYKANRSLVELSYSLANKSRAELHLVSAYSTTSMAVTIDLPEYNPADYGLQLQSESLMNLRDIPKIFSIDDKFIHIKQGLASDVIVEQVEELSTSLLVLGSNGRVGLSALFLGNTAESILDKARCNILILRCSD